MALYLAVRRWDASQIYGTDEAHARSLRVDGGSGCEMRLDDDGDLPLGDDGLPEGGGCGLRMQRL